MTHGLFSRGFHPKLTFDMTGGYGIAMLDFVLMEYDIKITFIIFPMLLYKIKESNEK